MIKRLSVTCLAVLLMTSLALAQPGQGRGRGPGGPGGGPGFGFGGFGRGGFAMGYMQLASADPVQTELKATDSQKTSIKELADKQAEERRAAREQGQGGGRGDFQNLTDEERRARFEEFRKEAAEREKKSREALAAILDDGQMKRLREIWVQMQGTGALSNDEVAAELKITDLQKEEINDTRDEARRDMGEQMRELFAPGQSDAEREAARTKFRDLQKQVDEKILANLTDEQKKQFADMQGAKFEMPQGVFGFGGGRFGQGGPGGPRPGGDGAGGGRRRPGGDGGNNGGGNRPRRPDSV